MLVFTVTVVSIVSQSVTVQGTGDAVDGEITSFGYNNPTDVSGLTIFSSGGSQDVGTLSRIGDFELNFKIYDIDGFRHLDVYVVLYNDDKSSENDDAGSGLTLDYINSGVQDNALVIRWLAPERSTYLSGLSDSFSFPIDSGNDNFLVKSGTSGIGEFYASGLSDFVRPVDFNAQSDVTWVVYSGISTITKSGVVSTFDASGVEQTSGTRVLQRDVTIPIRMSKVAPSSGVWNYAVYVFDRLQQEITTSKTGIVEPHIARADDSYDNQWYGEISVLANSGIIFPTVEAGSGNFTNSSGVISVNFISNGRYSQLVSSDTTWEPNAVVPGRPRFAYLVPNSGLTVPDGDDISVLNVQGNRFALQAKRVSIAGVNNDSPTTPVNVVLSSGARLVPENDDSNYITTRGTTANTSKIEEIATADGTTEFGVLSTFDFQIKLSSVFQTIHSVEGGPDETTVYRGNIQIGISNASNGSQFFDFNPGA
jgi:hypothetical protein